MDEKIRIDKLLSNLGYGSRKQIKKYASQGKIIINGDIIDDTSKLIDPYNDNIILNGEKVYYSKYKYVVMNKPQNYICANSDPIHKLVFDLLDANLSRYELSTAGRLDKDTEGLLILTNDGNFIHELISPNKNIYKKYLVHTDFPLSEYSIQKLREGIVLITENYITKPAIVNKISDNIYEISIMEGKYHQIKRMISAVGAKVTYLKRIQIGGYVLPDYLNPGEYIEVKKTDLDKILDHN